MNERDVTPSEHVDFFEIDEDLSAVAAAASPAVEEPAGLAEWVASLTTQERMSC